MIIVNKTRNCVLADNVVIADTPASRMRGLLGRRSMENGEALVIRPCSSAHMFFMKFSIDVVFLDKKDTVVGCCRSLPPFSLSPVFFNSCCAVELPAGTIERTATNVGDHILWESSTN